MQDTYDDTEPQEKDQPAQRIPQELPPVRIGEIGDDTKKVPERQKDLRERLPDTGLDSDDTIGDLPLIRRNPDTQIDEPPSLPPSDDTEDKTPGRDL